jgi:hypothetical protein
MPSKTRPEALAVISDNPRSVSGGECVRHVGLYGLAFQPRLAESRKSHHKTSLAQRAHGR